MKRNPCIEYIRLIACLIVVACHVNFQLASTADTEGLKTFYFCVFSDGVAIFWMITGCFLFQNSRLLPLIKRALTKVLLPTLLLSASPSPAGIFRSNTLITPGMSSYT